MRGRWVRLLPHGVAPPWRRPMASLLTNRLTILTVSKDYDER